MTQGISFSVKIEGLDRLKTAFKQSPLIVKEQIAKAIRLSALLVDRNTKLITPVSQVKGSPGGRLRSGIHTQITPFEARVVSTVDYGIYVHEGTRNFPLSMPPKKAGAVRQFMKIGAEHSEGKVQAMFQVAINNVVKRIAK